MSKPLVFLSSILFFCCKNKQEPSLSYQPLQHCRVEDSKDSIYCGSLAVWENRTTEAGRKINLAVTVIPVLHKDSVGIPIFYLEGGKRCLI